MWLEHEASHSHLGPVHLHFNPLDAELNPICHLLALLGAHHIFHVSRKRVNVMEFRSRDSFILVTLTGSP